MLVVKNGNLRNAWGCECKGGRLKDREWRGQTSNQQTLATSNVCDALAKIPLGGRCIAEIFSPAKIRQRSPTGALKYKVNDCDVKVIIIRCHCRGGTRQQSFVSAYAEFKRISFLLFFLKGLLMVRRE